MVARRIMRRRLLVVACILRVSRCQSTIVDSPSRRVKGYGHSTRIIGGSIAEEERYSYAKVSLQYDGRHKCGGTLVSRDMVLTAAHCIGEFNSIKFNVYNLVDATETVETFGNMVSFQHPNYDAETDQFDAMLVKVDGTVTLIDPVRINASDSNIANGDSLTVIGWGATAIGDPDVYPSTLHAVDVPYITNSRCGNMQDEGGWSLSGWLTSDMLCAGEPGKDACYGDSGSPLILKGDTPSDDLHVGIVSWGLDCGGDLPGVYSRVSSVYEWISTIVCDHSNSPPKYLNCGTARPSEAPSSTPSNTPSSYPSSAPIPEFEARFDRSGQDGILATQAPQSDKVQKATQPGGWSTSGAAGPTPTVASIAFGILLVLMGISSF